MNQKERDIQRKLRILRYAEEVGRVTRACRYFGIGRATFYLYVRLSHCKSILKRSAWPVANIYPASPG